MNLRDYRYNPSRMQREILNMIKNKVDGELDFVDPSNPFLMLMEANVALTSAAIIENNTNMMRMYPSMANRPEDLYNHIHSSELANMFAMPAVAMLHFRVSIDELKYNGLLSENGKYKSMILPMYTEIKGGGYTFTLLNDIEIRYYINIGNIHIEQKPSNDDLGIKELGVLKATIIKSDNEGTGWVLFNTLVKQVKRVILREDTITSSAAYTKSIIIDDQYHYSKVYVKNAFTNNTWQPIEVTHSDMVFNPNKPTIKVSLLDKVINFTVPEIYLINRTISGSIKIVVYTTKGKVYSNINQLEYREFEITLSSDNTDPAVAVSTNITKYVGGTKPLEGGRDAKTLTELREAIINNATGLSNVPITDKEIKEGANIRGYALSKSEDIITGRVYIANKPLPELESDNIDIKARMDIFTHKVTLKAENYTSNASVNIVGDSSIVILANTVFKDNNGVFNLLSDVEKALLTNMSDLTLINHLKSNRYYFTPYHYVSTIVDTSATLKTYDFNRPTLDNIRIIKKADHELSINVKQTGVHTRRQGFVVSMNTISNDAMGSIPLTDINAQLSMKIKDSEEYVYFYATMNPVNNLLVFYIDTNFFVTEDNTIQITNGSSNVSERYIDLESSVDIVLYIVNNNITRNEFIVNNDIAYDDRTPRQALTLETGTLSLGKELKNLWSNVSLEYTPRKFKTYEEDIPMVYEKDIIDVVVEGDEGYDPDDIVRYKHIAGDVVTDEDGNTLYLHRAGETVLDDTGSPILDTMAGLERIMTLVMLEYEFKVATGIAYENYLKSMLSILDSYINVDLEELNSGLIDNTYIYYIPGRNSKIVPISIGAKKYKLNNLMRPRVELYIDENSPILDSNTAFIRKEVGRIIHKHLDKTHIRVDDIKADLVGVFGVDLMSTKISGLDDDLGIEFYEFDDKLNKPTLAKRVYYNVNGEITVEYDIEVILHEMTM